MKLALNGALTIGTMDGANIEIHDEVGSDNIFIFGLRTDEVKQIQAVGYRPREYYDRQPELRKVLDMIGSGFFSPEEPDRYQALIEHLLERDPYLVLADYAGYVATQELVDELYLDRDTWLRKAILNTARMDKFCIDRTVWDYAQNVWDISPQCYIEESLPLSGPGVEVR
jgi:starch phosphorylase